MTRFPATRIGVDDRAVYFDGEGGIIRRVGKSGGDVVRLAATARPYHTQSIISIAAGGGYVYWIEEGERDERAYDAGSLVRRVATIGGEPETLDTLDAPPACCLAVAADDVFWVHGGAFHRWNARTRERAAYPMPGADPRTPFPRSRAVVADDKVFATPASGLWMLDLRTASVRHLGEWASSISANATHLFVAQSDRLHRRPLADPGRSEGPYPSCVWAAFPITDGTLLAHGSGNKTCGSRPMRVDGARSVRANTRFSLEASTGDGRHLFASGRRDFEDAVIVRVSP